MISRLLLASLAILYSLHVSAEEEKALTSEKQKLGYALGFEVAQGIKRMAVDVDIDALTQAIRDSLTGARLKISVSEMKAAISTLEQQQRQAIADNNKQAGEAFLAANKDEEGVVNLPSGLQYKIIQQGAGKKPTATDTVMVHYRGRLINGTEFDSSIRRGNPVSFQLNGVIAGWQEALQLMQPGAKWEVYIPPSLAYGSRGAPGAIGPEETLIFEIELLEVVTPKEE